MAFLEAREAGLGYLEERDDILYIIPTPTVLLDERNRFHSETHPAISWKGGEQYYFLHGVNLPKKLHKEITSRTIEPKKAVMLPNIEHRVLALQYLGGQRLMEALNGKVIAKDEYGELVEFKNLKDGNEKPYKYLVAIDPSKGEKVWLRTWPEIKTPAEAEARSYRLERFNLTYQPSSRT